MLMVKQMSLGQFASGIIGAVCYRRSQAVTHITIPMFWLGKRNICNVGFKWVCTTGSLGQILRGH